MTAFHWLIVLGVVVLVSALYALVNQLISEGEDKWRASFPSLFIGLGISTALALIGVYYWEM